MGTLDGSDRSKYKKSTGRKMGPCRSLTRKDGSLNHVTVSLDVTVSLRTTRALTLGQISNALVLIKMTSTYLHSIRRCKTKFFRLTASSRARKNYIQYLQPIIGNLAKAIMTNKKLFLTISSHIWGQPHPESSPSIDWRSPYRDTISRPWKRRSPWMR